MSVAGLFEIKSGFALVVLAVGVAGAFLPWSLGRRSSNERALAIGDTFAGGVLGGAGLIHLLDDGISGFHTTLPRVAYPIGLLLCGVGFLLILLIEGVVVTGRQAADQMHTHQVATQHELGWDPCVPRPAPYPIVLLIVLSVHSVILGMALGAQRSLAGSVLIFLAILAHKGVAGFALGVGYRRGGSTRRRAAPEITFFATMTPLGIMVGSVVGALLVAHAGQLFEATFDSLGAGTFLYIAALDIMKTEFDNPSHRGQKWLAACAGFGLMAVLALWL